MTVRQLKQRPAPPGNSEKEERMVYTPAELAKRWKVSSDSVIRLIVNGELRGFQIGKQWRVTEESVLALERGERN